MSTGLTTLSCKNKHVTETATEETKTTGRDGLPGLSSDARMNAIGESRKEASGRKVEVLNAKLKTKIGFWNVRTMYDTGKLAQVTLEMKRYNIDILGISESRWTGSGRITTSTGSGTESGT